MRSSTRFWASARALRAFSSPILAAASAAAFSTAGRGLYSASLAGFLASWLLDYL